MSLAVPHRRCVIHALLCLLLWLPMVAQAQTRAWLDRSQVGLGETVTLNIETDSAASPDLAPLQADFEVGSQSRSQQTRWSGGRTQRSTLFGFALTPRRSGSLTVPALSLGSARTAPLPLQVDAVAGRSDSDARAFIEVVVDDDSPYVQQSVGVVVQLYYAAQLAAGELVLDAPDGASLQVVGQDRSDVQEINGRRYNRVQRHYLLVPERSGALTLPAARFSGRTAGGFFQDMFGTDPGDGRISAASNTQVLQVQPQPADAPLPWLPLHQLSLRYTQVPRQAQAGQAATVEVEARVRGATRSQFPALPVPDAVDGAQLFAEPAQYEESFDGATPVLRVTRRYAVVPRAGGTLQVPGLQMAWWDVGAGQARQASLPPLPLQVAAAADGQGAGTVQAIDTQSALPDDATAAAPVSGTATADRPWPWLAAVGGLLLLWLLTLVWGWRRGRRAALPSATSAVAGPARSSPSTDATALRRLLDTGDLGEVADHLCAMAGVARLEQVIEKLGDPRQRQALMDLQRARWAGQGDLPAVRRALRQAFHDRPHWSTRSEPAQTALPPLYPPG